MQLSKTYEQEVNRRVFIRTGIFFLGSCVTLLSGCATKSTQQCLELGSGEDQLECIQEQLFPSVIGGALAGAVAGAVLAGAVAFATHRPTGTYIAVGGIVGGVAGGIIAYYNFTSKRANGNPNRAISDINQDTRSDEIRLQRYKEAVLNASYEITRSKNSQVESINKRVEKLEMLLVTALTQYKQAQEVYKETSRKWIGQINTNNKRLEEITYRVDKNLLLLNDMYQEIKKLTRG